ncbi:uncharacterized protein LOC113067559 [Carassius auratus]|uniref:Uncharacterized protein LOC113067559 n=1 Tax=Carassius auratus TaxID=7957 RepID=A0A6P6MI79_CARAU|nr:uncharacterized protein LOC113067559 [Carassius auratus]
MSISASVGEDVTLNCSVDSHITPEHIEEVSWKKTDEDEDILVLLYQNNQTLLDSSHERYRDRAELFTAEIPKGNFSLRLKSVRTEDKGVYMCKVFSGGLSASATVVLERLGLTVRSPSGPLVAPLGSSVVLPCYVDELLSMESLEVEWRRTDSETHVIHVYKDGQAESQHQDYHDRAHFFTDQIQHGKFSLRLDNLTAEDEGPYTCTVSAKSNLKLSVLDPCRIPDSLLRLHLFLVFCPNIIMFFAFVFWGVSEGSLNESVSCCALYFLRPIVLLWAAPYVKEFTYNSKRRILKYGYFAEYVPFSIVVYSALFKSTLQKVQYYPEFDKIVIKVLFSVVILTCFCKIIYVFIIEIGIKRGRKIELFDLVADMTFDIVPTLQFILLFYTFASIRGAFIVIVILPVLLMMTNDRWTFRCGRLKCPPLVIRTLMLIFIFVINSVMLILYCLTVEKKTDPIGWGCVMVFMQIIWVVMKFTDEDFIYLRFDQAFHRSGHVYLFGSIGCILLTSIAIITEIMLRANGDRTVGDLRFIVFPLESFFILCVLISGHIPPKISEMKCSQCCQEGGRCNDLPATRSNQNQDSQNAEGFEETSFNGSNPDHKTE